MPLLNGVDLAVLDFVMGNAIQPVWDSAMEVVWGVSATVSKDA